ncbi:MAG: DedA family protein [Candidatus Doudnabacteria bacterium]|nr:DedA family protein [Candidatus Doudnabacteria bacterium]
MSLDYQEVIVFVLHYGYWFAIPLMIVEGPVTTIVMGFLSSFGYFHPFGVFLAGLFADLVSDSVYYLAGYFSGDRLLKKFGRFFHLSEKTLPGIKSFYALHGGKSIFLAKILPGLVPPVITVAGITKTSFQKFLLFATLGGVVWSAGLVVFGYYFGSQFEGNFSNLKSALGQSGLVMFSVFATFVVYRVYLHKIVERKLKLFLDNNAKQDS